MPLRDWIEPKPPLSTFLLEVAASALVSTVSAFKYNSSSINLFWKFASIWRSGSTLFQTVRMFQNFDGKLARIFAITWISGRFCPKSSSCLAMFCTWAMCCDTESFGSILYSWNFWLSNSLWDSDFCSWIEVNLVHISRAVVQDSKHTSWLYSMAEDIKNFAFALSFIHALTLPPLPAGLTLVPSIMSAISCATKTAFNWNFHPKKFLPSNFVTCLAVISPAIFSFVEFFAHYRALDLT